jgi:hypothetical protein
MAVDMSGFKASGNPTLLKKEMTDYITRKTAEQDSAKAADQSKLAAQKSAIQRRADTVSAARTPIQAEGYKAEAAPQATARNTGPVEGYDKIRTRALSQARAGYSGASDAINRRFAALGAANSGAAIKQQQLADQSQADKEAQVLEGVGMQEDAERRRLNEASEQRDFAATEAVKARNFQGSEASRGRKMQADLYNADQDFKQKVFAFDAESKLADMDRAFEEFQINKDVIEFNKRKARYEAGNTGGLFGSGGFLGTGIGASSSDEF